MQIDFLVLERSPEALAKTSIALAELVEKGAAVLLQSLQAVAMALSGLIAVFLINGRSNVSLRNAAFIVVPFYCLIGIAAYLPRIIKLL